MTILPFPHSPPQARLRLAARNDRPAIPSCAAADAAHSAFAAMRPAFAPWAGRKVRVRATGEIGRVVGWLRTARFVVQMQSGERRSYRPGEIEIVGPEPERRAAA